MSITFLVDQTTKIEKPYPTKEQAPATLWAKVLGTPKGQLPEAYSQELFIPGTSHPLVSAIGTAWNRHYPLILSPDMVWTTIAQSLAKYIEKHPEEMRKHFVTHEGQKHLEISRDNFQKGNPGNDWPGCFKEFSDLLAAHIGKRRDLIVNNFSTTTPISKTASELVLMDAMKSYFSYGMSTCCAMTEVTLEGTVEDWEDVYRRAQMLEEFGLKYWTDDLLPVIEGLVLSAKGAIHKSFWNSAYQSSGGSGEPRVTGWVNSFFLYDKHDNQRTKVTSGMDQDSYPNGLSKAPMDWHYYNTTYPMELIGGLPGTKFTEAGAVTPVFGWAVVDKVK